jgi:Mrp family chromosome partitioning ATPase
MIEQCKARFDYIIVDTPPLGSVADALNIAKHCDGTLLVIRSGEVPRKVVNDSVSLLRRTEVPLLGVVLNRVDTSKRGSNYGYYYRYGYYSNYGNGNGKSDKKKPK